MASQLVDEASDEMYGMNVVRVSFYLWMAEPTNGMQHMKGFTYQMETPINRKPASS